MLDTEDSLKCQWGQTTKILNLKHNFFPKTPRLFSQLPDRIRDISRPDHSNVGSLPNKRKPSGNMNTYH